MSAFAGIAMNTLVRVRLLAFVCRLWGLVGAFGYGAGGSGE